MNWILKDTYILLISDLLLWSGDNSFWSGDNFVLPYQTALWV